MTSNISSKQIHVSIKCELTIEMIEKFVNDVRIDDIIVLNKGVLKPNHFSLYAKREKRFHFACGVRSLAKKLKCPMNQIFF